MDKKRAVVPTRFPGFCCADGCCGKVNKSSEAVHESFKEVLSKRWKDGEQTHPDVFKQMCEFFVVCCLNCVESMRAVSPSYEQRSKYHILHFSKLERVDLALFEFAGESNEHNWTQNHVPGLIHSIEYDPVRRDLVVRFADPESTHDVSRYVTLGKHSQGKNVTKFDPYKTLGSHRAVVTQQFIDTKELHPKFEPWRNKDPLSRVFSHFTRFFNELNGSKNNSPIVEVDAKSEIHIEFTAKMHFLRKITLEVADIILSIGNLLKTCQVYYDAKENIFVCSITGQFE